MDLASRRLALSLFASAALAGCSMARPVREGAPRAEIVANWPSIPADAKFGQVSAVDVDAQGRVYVLHRAGRAWNEPFPSDPIADPTVFVFDGASGQLLARWGAGQFIMPHGLSIDPQGKIWITDVAREQVLRFSSTGALELTLGERGMTGDDQRHFGRPSDVAFAGEEVFVSDGYLNHRVAVFDRQGRYLRQWGEQGLGPRGLAIPHAIAIGGGRVFVADREHRRIQVTDLAGKPIASWPTGGATGHPYSLKLLPDGRLVSIEGRDSYNRSGALLRVWQPDGTIEQTLDLALPGEQASLGHDLAFGSDGFGYAADVYGNRVVKFALTPTKGN